MGLARKEIGKFRGAGVCLTFDDTPHVPGWVDANVILSKYGWKATFAIYAPSFPPATGIDYLIPYKDGINVLKNAGHEIANHTKAHNDYTLLVSESDFFTTWIDTMQNVYTQVFDWIPSSFLYAVSPGQNITLNQIILNNKYINRVRPYINTENFVTENNISKVISAPDAYKLYYEPYGNWDALFVALQEAKNTNTILMLLMHKIENNMVNFLSVPISVLEQLCQTVQASGMQFYRMCDLPVSE